MDILEGLQIPKESTKEVKNSVKKVYVKPVCSDEELEKKEGTYMTEKDVKTIYNEDVDVYDGETLIAKFRKNVIPKEVIQIGWEAFYETAATSQKRGAAAGPIKHSSTYWKKRKPVETNKWSTKYIVNGKVSKMKLNNLVFSSILGYFEKTPFMKLPCRLTSYTQRFFENYKLGIPYIQFLNNCFKILTPTNYAKQLARAKKNPSYRIDDTAFSSVTINRNFRTALHQDDGDFKEGFGNLSVIERGRYSGGETIIPKYGIGFNVRTGDFLAMDVHQFHCNTEMRETESQKEYNNKLPRIHFDKLSTGTLGSEKKFTRISFVCYLREKLIDCKRSETKKYYSQINFNETKGSLKKKSRTKTIKHKDK